MGDTLDYLESNAEELGNEACGLSARHHEYVPDRMGITSYGHPRKNETVMHWDIGIDRPGCFLTPRYTKWQMTGRKNKVTCKNCINYFRELQKRKK